MAGTSTRREILSAGLLLAAGAPLAEALQHAHQAKRQGATVRTLPADVAAEVEALACQILPSGDGPGARETGVIHFIDGALATFDADKKGPYLKWMDEVQQVRKKMFPESANIRGLADAEQIALLRAIEAMPFFETLRTHTLMGFLGSPEYGGNRAGAGWAYIRFEDRMAFEPPFGAYDTAAERGRE
jgi:gluconate 2-dehydrogenase gamma chain